MKQRARPLNRLLSLLLALVMTLALLPTAVLADNPWAGEGSGSAGDNYEGSGTHSDWMPVGYGKTFVRFTIIKFTEGVDGWQSPGSVQVYGQSLDMSDSYTVNDAATVQKWWNTNAMTAKVRSLTEPWNNYYAQGYSETGYSSRFFDFSTVTGQTLPVLFGDGASGSNQFVQMFTTGEGDKSEPSAAFKALIAKIGENVPTEKRLDADDFRYGRDKLGESGTVDYRLIIEPGVFTEIDGKVAAMTWRDMAAYTLNNSASATNKTPAYTWHTNSQNIVYGLYLTRDEFVSGTGEDSKQVGTKAFSAVSETPQFGKNAPKHFKDFRTDCMDTGYALSIINPGDMGGKTTYNSYVGRINLYVPTETELTAKTTGEALVGSEVYTYIGEQAGLIGNQVNYQWKNPYEPETTRYASIEDNSEATVTAYDRAKNQRDQETAMGLGQYAYLETTIRNDLFNSGLSAQNFDSAASKIVGDGLIDHNVLQAPEKLKDGLEWGYIGEAVFNLNM